MAEPPHPSLRRDAISSRGAGVLSLAAISPVTAMVHFVPLMVVLVGARVPFVVLLGLVGVLCLATTLAQFARWVPSAGSFYAFNSLGLGPLAGFASGWMLVLVYAVAVPGNMLVLGPVASDALERHLGVDVPWWLVAVAGFALVTTLVVEGIAVSVRVDLTLLTVQMLSVLLLALVVLTDGGASGHAPEALGPSSSVLDGGTPVALGFVFLMFVGFEVAYTASEETTDARRSTARAMLGAVTLAACFIVLVSYATIVAFGTDGLGRLATDPLPFGTMGRTYIGSEYGVLLEFLVIAGLVSSSIGLSNGLVRVVFALARDGVLPAPLARLHPRRRTPYVAALTACGTGAGAALGLGLAVGPYPEAFGYFAGLVVLPVLLLYASACVSLTRYVRRERPQDFHAGRHLLVPALGLVIVGLAAYGAYHPWPTGVALTMNLVFLVYLAAGLALGARWLRGRARRALATDAV